MNISVDVVLRQLESFQVIVRSKENARISRSNDGHQPDTTSYFQYGNILDKFLELANELIFRNRSMT